MYTINERVGRTANDIQIRVSLEYFLFTFLVSVIFLVRVVNLTYNTLFLDEAIYANVRHDISMGIFTRGLLSWGAGSYLYPIMAGFADKFRGVVGIRLLSAVMTTIGAVFIYLAARQMFGKHAGLWAMLIFGVTGVSINLGQFGVYDLPSVMFLPATLYCLVTAAQLRGRKETIYLLAACGCFTVAVLGKYIGFLYLPALML